MGSKLTKKECIRDTKAGYGIKENYILYLEKYSDHKFEYDELNKTNLCDAKVVDLIEINKEIGKISVFKNENINLKELKEAINVICRKNIINTVKENKNTAAVIAYNEKIDKLKSFIEEKYGEQLSYDIQKNKALYNNVIIDKATYDTFLQIVIKELNEMYKYTDIKTVVTNIAKRHPFEKVPEFLNEFMDTDGIDTQNYKDKFDIDEKGNLEHSINNYYLYLKYGKTWANRLAINLFNKDECIFDGNSYVFRKPNEYDPKIKLSIEKEFGANIKRASIEDAVNLVQYENGFHPIKDRLNSLIWDGKKRLETFFIDYFDADDTVLNRHMTEKWFVGSIKRVMEEGGNACNCVNFDYMLILFGDQGNGKSSIWKRFFGNEYIDNSIKLSDNLSDIVGKLNKAWCVVFDELAGFNWEEMNQVKNFITTHSYTVRLSYDKRPSFFPVHCVYCGNTNKQFFLTDEAYERRFWVIDTHSSKRSEEWWRDNLSDEYCNQVMAEAMNIYKTQKDYTFTLNTEDDEALYKVQQTHKTFELDTVMNETIADLLKCKFNKEIFNDEDDFIDNIIPINYEAQGYELNIVRGNFLVKYLQKKDIKIKSPIKLKQIMATFGWTYVKYRRKQIKQYENTWCFVKKEYEFADIPLKKSSAVPDKLPF